MNKIVEKNYNFFGRKCHWTKKAHETLQLYNKKLKEHKQAEEKKLKQNEALEKTKSAVYELDDFLGSEGIRLKSLDKT